MRICKNLIQIDLMILCKTFFDKFIDLCIWVVLTMVVMSYIMPYFGLSADFGVFQLGGVIASTGLFELYTNVVDLVSDFEGDRIINYNLTLPLPSWMALISKSIYYGIVYLILALLMLPVGKLSLWNQFDLWQISYFKFAIAILAQSIFYACFVLWISSSVANMTRLGSVWGRFIFPMWFLGGYQFSWVSLHQAIPILAYINLINPMIYITEAVRVALLGQAEYLNFWLCIAAIIGFSFVCLYIGIMNLKKRLDFV
jgi:hypothetical protein